MTRDGLATSSIWKWEFIHGMADPMRDLDERDESENDANEQDHNDQPSEDEDSLLRDMQEAPVDHMALYSDEDDEDSDTHMDHDQGDFDSRVSDDDTHHKATDTFDVLERHQMKNGRRKAPSPTHLARTRSSRKHRSTRPHEAGSKSRQHPSSHGSRRPSLERACTSSSSGRLALGRAPHRAPSEKTASTRVRPERPPAHLSVTRSKSPQRLPCSSSRKLSPRRRSPTQSMVSSSHKLPSSHGWSLSQSLPRHSAQPDWTPSPAPSSSRSHSCSASPVQHSKSGDGVRCANQQGNPSKLSFYPASWQAFLQAAKLEMRLQAVLLHPLPVHQDAVVLAQEVLSAVLWTYHTKKVKLDKGYFPEYKVPMSRLLCDDLFTFRMELKKIMISIVKQLYGIFSKGNSMHKERISAAAAKLLKTGEYLQLPDSSEGKYTNFVSQVLKEACLSFYYGNSKKALKLTDEFQHQIPVNSLILVAVVAKDVLSGFRDSGTDKVPDLTADTCRAEFNILRKSVDKLMDIPERRVELEEMLREWAEEGMIGELCNDSDSAAGSEDINIII
ncbi:uncharacterized protein HD556DRAFT_1436118 [Suillus plorans]|uniref:DUF6532 domain-containing protein n=1 Tax=Suillus plorans TaxID=116603 RepID=A0A9P7E3P6_9AGAM|nr:uncharacterized protein HD556DRAFT_1436118 [Suillus plorans]KAG1810370.1 hypothetical protein HD556DRAFT_1436118 [Suillus plorans]